MAVLGGNRLDILEKNNTQCHRTPLITVGLVLKPQLGTSGNYHLVIIRERSCIIAGDQIEHLHRLWLLHQQRHHPREQVAPLHVGDGDAAVRPAPLGHHLRLRAHGKGDDFTIQ